MTLNENCTFYEHGREKATADGYVMNHSEMSATYVLKCITTETISNIAKPKQGVQYKPEIQKHTAESQAYQHSF